MTGENQKQAMLDTILHPGQILGGKYRVDKLLGKGGMAAVWAGENQPTGKRVALKVILRSFVAASGGDSAELFRREALAAGRVNHPNVVNVFDVIDHEGLTCIVMELLDGEPFGTYLARKGFLSVEEAVTMLLPAMRGVAAANAEGVVHRDLKPQNIFLCVGPDGRYVTTKVLDFGISVIMEKAMEAGTSTRQVTTHGTPAYMSPEHITGAPNIDERADVYGFGVLFYEALSGQLPFLGEPGPALLMRILSSPAPRITLFRPDLPAPLVEIIERAMDRDPARRFQSLDEFVRAIEEFTYPPSPLPRSLTPMAGVPIIALSEPKSGSVGDTIVRSIHRDDASGLHPITETRALYSLSSNGPNANIGVNATPDATWEITPPPVLVERQEQALEPASQADIEQNAPQATPAEPSWQEPAREELGLEERRRESQSGTRTTQINLPRWNPNVVATRVAMALALVTGVALVAWLLMPIDSSPSTRRELEADFSYHPRPVVSPLVPSPTPPTPEPTPAPSASEPTPAAQAPSPEPTPARPEADPRPTGLAAPLAGAAEQDDLGANRQASPGRKAIERERPAPAPRAKSMRGSSPARPAAPVAPIAPTHAEDERRIGVAGSATGTATRTRTGTQTSTRTRTSLGSIPRAGSLSPDDF
jgi:serine/threonine protein kinase